MLVAVLFVGQFTRGVGTGWARADLRQISDSDVQQLRTLMLPLRSYLIDVLAELERQHRHHQTGRRGLIEEYIQESLSAGPRLAELASRLSLSQSRTSHVIRELTGRPFQELVAEYRISVARDLLAETNGTVAWIARQTGFKDSGYFCRYFKHKTGTSPMGFRGQFRRVVQV
jgi:AraC-like DNA-binding protein